jgi:hypothetical protein
MCLFLPTFSISRILSLQEKLVNRLDLSAIKYINKNSFIKHTNVTSYCHLYE